MLNAADAAVTQAKKKTSKSRGAGRKKREMFQHPKKPKLPSIFKETFIDYIFNRYGNNNYIETSFTPYLQLLV